MPRKPPKKALETLLKDIQYQYLRRAQMMASAGGKPEDLQGSLTAYLDYEMLRAVFGVPKVNTL